MEDFPRAENEYLKVEKSESNRDRIGGLAYSGYLYLMQGKYVKAAAKWRATEEIDQKNGDNFGDGVDHYYLSDVHFRRGNDAQALEETRNAKRSLIASHSPGLRGACDALAAAGMICLALNQRQELQELTGELKTLAQETVSVFPNMARYSSLAQALLDLAEKNSAKAIAGLEEFIRLRTYP